ncbi:MAG TPA: isomerizing glutamine--fructose-6-phosphate transaminase [Candidatus Angelobacter sp.]|nr:isomerizing glutamine--fructose-6-phosphate transaminase [Candidatus Angelobacter sp.]
MHPDDAKDKNGFPHFMLKEIYEQPAAVGGVIADCFDAESRVTFPNFVFSPQEISAFSRITVAASGSSRHAGLVGEFMLERMAGLSVEVDFASQYCYRNPLVLPNELTIFPSQSGTTIDTLAALQIARRKGAKSLAICNVPDSPLTRSADATLLTRAGEEIAIAATKSFTTQLTALFLLGAYAAQVRQKADRFTQSALRELRDLPNQMERALSTDTACRRIAKEIYGYKDFIYVGRDIDYPIALEGALKLKEISYIHAEGIPTGELKHGPTALLGEQFVIVIIATRDRDNEESVLRYSKSLSNVIEFMERQGPVVAIVTEGDEEISKVASYTVSVPDVPVLLQPIVEVIPLQFLAYHIAVQCGRDIDRPRHLSKSVVIE